ncbi:MAG: response regulator transcription factor [Acidimicrobiia bacterium]|nr:response regulator transcription factor [Acidimicrobiia bacterium]
MQAFELNAIDYLLKPVERTRLAATLERARSRLTAVPADRARQLIDASAALDSVTRTPYLERIPARRRDETEILPVRHISSVVAKGELLHLTTIANDRFTIAHRLHALEARLDPRRFVRLSRGTLASVDQIRKVAPMPGGTCQVQIANGETLQVSRIQSRLLRDLLRRLSPSAPRRHGHTALVIFLSPTIYSVLPCLSGALRGSTCERLSLPPYCWLSTSPATHKIFKAVPDRCTLKCP